MAIADDFEIQADGDIRHVANSNTYTVLELHRWLQDEADDAAAAGDDFIDITYTTPSERATDNIITLLAPFNINDTAAQYLYDGSVAQTNPTTLKADLYAGLVVVGSGAVASELRILQDEDTFAPTLQGSGNPNAGAAILARFLVKVKSNGATIDGQKLVVMARELGDTYAEFAVTMTTGNNVAAIFTADDLNNDTDSATIDMWDDVVNTEGYQLLDISGNAVTEPYYSKWDKDTRTAGQLYERTKWLARTGNAETLHGLPGDEFRGITHEFTYNGQATNFATNNTVVWGTSLAYDGGTGTVPVVGHYVENTLSTGFGKVVYVSAGAGMTGTIVVQREAATPAWSDNDTFSIRTTGVTGAFVQNGADIPTTSASFGGSAVVLADDDNGTDGTLWVQLVSGTIAGTSDPIWIRGGAAAKAADASSTATQRTIKPEFVGVFTGTSFIGAFGIGMETTEVAAADLFTDLVGSTWNPPNQQDFTVLGLLSGDRVLVTNDQAGNIDFDQFTTTATLDQATEPTVDVNIAIPVDTPAAGFIRVELDTGVYRRVEYTSWTASAFTLAVGPDDDWTGGNVATTGANVFIGYIDIATATTEETFTAVYSGSNRTLFIRVRDGGVTPIKTFQTTGTFTSAGGSTTAIRTADD